MQLVTKIANVANAAPRASLQPGKTEALMLERIRKANADLQRQVAVANHNVKTAIADRKTSENRLAIVNSELEIAKKTIASLHQRIKELTDAMNESVAKVTKKDKKFESGKKPQEFESGVKISVN